VLAVMCRLDAGVMLRLSGITIDSHRPAELAIFWATALGYDERPLWGSFTGIKDPSGLGPHLTFQEGDAEVGARLHLDLYADDPDGEVARLVQLGAERVRRVEEGDTWWWIMRDPDANVFCVIAAQGRDRSL
jgi:Glyoxalase-like domain